VGAVDAGASNSVGVVTAAEGVESAGASWGCWVSGPSSSPVVVSD
jgi:hypothetical protein